MIGIIALLLFFQYWCCRYIGVIAVIAVIGVIAVIAVIASISHRKKFGFPILGKKWEIIGTYLGYF